MEKTHWKRLVNPDYIGAYSLPDGKDMIVTIEKVVREMVTGTGGKKEECTVAYLKGQKPMILNRTNCKQIQMLYNTPFIEDWAGKEIQLYAAVTKLKGEEVECLRVRNFAPKAAELPELLINSEAFNKVKQALESGNYQLSDVMKKYKITEECRVALNV